MPTKTTMTNKSIFKIAFGSTSSTPGAASVMNQLASEKMSADSGAALLSDVYQRAQALASVDGADASSVINPWEDNLAALKETQKGLLELEDQAVFSASGRLIHSTLKDGVASAIRGYEEAMDLGVERGTHRMQQSERSVLAGVTKVSALVEDLEKDSLSVLKVKGAYGSGFFEQQLKTLSFTKRST